MATEPSSTNNLARVLGPWMATAIVVGTVIGSGVFKKAQAVAERVDEFGPTLMIWVLGGVLALMGALVIAEIAILLPRAGGNYVYLREGYGRPFGFLWGWVEFWIIRSGSIAALASIFTDSLHDVIKHYRGVPITQEVLSFWPRQSITVITILVLASVNARGTRWGGLLQLFLTIVKVGSLLGLALLPFLYTAFTSDPTDIVTTANLLPWWPSNWETFRWSQLGGAMVGVLWAYHGWMNITPVAEEVRNPNRNIPRSLIIGTMLVTLLYVSVNYAYAMVVPRAEMAGLKNTAVATVFSAKLLGDVGLLLASGALMVSVFGSLNGNLLVGPRLLFAMARDGLAPKPLSRIHSKYETPWIAIMILASWSCVLIVGGAALTRSRFDEIQLFGYAIDPNIPAGKSLFDVITDFAMFGAISFETLAVSTIFVFRRRYPKSQVELPYRCWGYPIVPIVYIAVMGTVLANMFISQQMESMIGLGFIALGAIVYWRVFARR